MIARCSAADPKCISVYNDDFAATQLTVERFYSRRRRSVAAGARLHRAGCTQERRAVLLDQLAPLPRLALPRLAVAASLVALPLCASLCFALPLLVCAGRCFAPAMQCYAVAARRPALQCRAIAVHGYALALRWYYSPISAAFPAASPPPCAAGTRPQAAGTLHRVERQETPLHPLPLLPCPALLATNSAPQSLADRCPQVSAVPNTTLRLWAGSALHGTRMLSGMPSASLEAVRLALALVECPFLTLLLLSIFAKLIKTYIIHRVSPESFIYIHAYRNFR